MAAKFLGQDGEENHVEAIRSGGLIISGGRAAASGGGETRQVEEH